MENHPEVRKKINNSIFTLKQNFEISFRCCAKAKRVIKEKLDRQAYEKWVKLATD